MMRPSFVFEQQQQRFGLVTSWLCRWTVGAALVILDVCASSISGYTSDLFEQLLNGEVIDIVVAAYYFG
mgnify:CR=1 FL=1